MAEEQRARIDDAMTKMLEDVDKSFIRVLQGKMFRCAEACCADKNSSMVNVQRCIENCGVPLKNAQNIVKGEFDYFQNRLQRCVMTCNDTIRDKMGSDVKDSDISRYTNEFEVCATKCVDSHIALIPEVLKKMKDALKKNKTDFV